MKISEMVKKVEAYNEIDREIYNHFTKAYLHVNIGGYATYRVDSAKTFKRFIKSEYIDIMAKPIINYDGYKFGEKVIHEAVDEYGNVLHESVEFYVTTSMI